METTEPPFNQELHNELQKLNKNIHRSNSIWRSLFKGLATGIGGALGATIVTGIIIAILAQTIHSVHDIPIIGNLITTFNLEELFPSPPPLQ